MEASSVSQRRRAVECLGGWWLTARARVLALPFRYLRKLAAKAKAFRLGEQSDDEDEWTDDEEVRQRLSLVVPVVLGVAPAG